MCCYRGDPHQYSQYEKKAIEFYEGLLRNFISQMDPKRGVIYESYACPGAIIYHNVRFNRISSKSAVKCEIWFIQKYP